jgi:hypothetical protein
MRSCQRLLISLASLIATIAGCSTDDAADDSLLPDRPDAAPLARRIVDDDICEGGEYRGATITSTRVIVLCKTSVGARGYAYSLDDPERVIAFEDPQNSLYSIRSRGETLYTHGPEGIFTVPFGSARLELMVPVTDGVYNYAAGSDGIYMVRDRSEAMGTRMVIQPYDLASAPREYVLDGVPSDLTDIQGAMWAVTDHPTFLAVHRDTQPLLYQRSQNEFDSLGYAGASDGIAYVTRRLAGDPGQLLALDRFNGSPVPRPPCSDDHDIVNAAVRDGVAVMEMYSPTNAGSACSRRMWARDLASGAWFTSAPWSSDENPLFTSVELMVDATTTTALYIKSHYDDSNRPRFSLVMDELAPAQP